MRKFKRAVTDSDTERCVRYDPEHKPGVANLMTIYSAVTGKSYEEIEAEFDGQGYGAFKPAVGEAVVETAAPHPGGGRAASWPTRPIWRAVYQAGAEKAVAMWPTRPCARSIKRWALWPDEPDRDVSDIPRHDR